MFINFSLPEFDPQHMQDIFSSSPKRPDRLWGPTQLAVQGVPGDPSLEVKRPGSDLNLITSIMCRGEE